MTYKRRILAVEGDFHAGHKLGLCHPDSEIVTVDEDGNQILEPVALNAAQKYLWDIHEWGQAEIQKLADKDEIVVVHTGDPTNGNAHSEGNFTSSKMNQTNIAEDILSTWLDLKQVKRLRMVASTESHVFTAGMADVMIEQGLKKRYKKTRDIKLVNHGLLSINGVNVDIAHHGPASSSREWLDGNTPRYYLNSIYYQALREQRPIPDLVLRGHVHVRVDETLTKFVGDERQRIHMMTVPSMQLMTPYARKVTRSSPEVTNGMLAVEIVDDKVRDTYWFARTKDLRAREEL